MVGPATNRKAIDLGLGERLAKPDAKGVTLECCSRWICEDDAHEPLSVISVFLDSANAAS